jgi:YegS/Rv2252/BmrU family lipid kinase
MGPYFSVESRIEEVCKKYNIQYAIEYTQHRGHAIILAKDASTAGHDYVVAVGGDGTINEVAQGLVDTNTTMGILPRGSGNGLARHLGIPSLLTDAIDSLFDKKIIRMDTLIVNNRLSLNVSGIGFDGHVANLFANRKIRGLFGYVRLVLAELFRFNEFKAEITVDGTCRSERAFIIALANSSQYGNNIRIAPYASVTDGKFDLTVMKKISMTDVGFIYAFLRGNLKKSALCDMSIAGAATITTAQPVAYHIDGEPCGLADRFTIELKPTSLSVLVPHSF